VAPDALCLQGAEAGAHRGSLANTDRADADRPLRALLASVRRRTLVPLVTAGGVAGPDDVTDLLARGAALVQAGTAFLRCPESGTQALAKDALADPSFTATAVTRAFSGRRARALVNAMVREHRDAPAAYPEINNATRPLRAAAAEAGDPGHMSLYAGTGFRGAEARPAAEVVQRLVSGWRR
jgi:nitronate monooxygenase